MEDDVVMVETYRDPHVTWRAACYTEDMQQVDRCFDEVRRISDAFGVGILEGLEAPEGEPLGDAPGPAKAYRLPGGGFVIWIEKLRDVYDTGYMLHELAHILIPESVEDDEMRALVVQHLLICGMPSGVSGFFREEMEGYGFDWEDEPNPDPWHVTSGLIGDFGLLPSTQAYQKAWEEIDPVLLKRLVPV